jgi:hypothetical protein
MTYGTLNLNITTEPKDKEKTSSLDLLSLSSVLSQLTSLLISRSNESSEPDWDDELSFNMGSVNGTIHVREESSHPNAKLRVTVVLKPSDESESSPG